MTSYQETYRELIVFLWKWKISSTAALSAKFFSHLPQHSAYKKLRYLETTGLIQSGRERFSDLVIWTLTREGFESIRNVLPALKQEGFKSEFLDHDRIVTAVHIGDALLNRSLGLELLSEQQLRRYHGDSLPKWVPTSKLHRPDGYWCKTGENGEPKVVSLEVEISSKNDSDYHGIARFYSRHPSIGRVVWVCNNQRFATRLLERLKEGDPKAQHTHSFFILREIEKLGWGAFARVGANTGQTLRSMLVSTQDVNGVETDRNMAGNRLEDFPVTLLFDFRKSRTNFKAYASWIKSQKV